MNTHTVIRQTAKADFSTIYQLVKTAFETAEHSDGDEQDFVVNLRNGANYIAALDLMAEVNGEAVGHIMLTKTFVTLPSGSKHNTLLVAPLSVLLAHRSMGIGSALMNEGLRLAASLGYETAFLIGDPNYYQRFGFKRSHLYNINHHSFPAEYVMAKEITPDALKGITGEINM